MDTLDREWAITRAKLYDKQRHLYYRDDRFLDTHAQHEANGQPIFWSRGNGWVIAGLVQILQALPADNPRRAPYAAQFVEMMRRVAALQPADGLWRAGLLDSGGLHHAGGLRFGLLRVRPRLRTYAPACWTRAHLPACARTLLERHGGAHLR